MSKLRRRKDLRSNKKVPGTPEWFRAGVEAALLAPTAMNQQKFTFFYTKINLGIVKYHFEIGAGKENFQWG